MQAACWYVLLLLQPTVYLVTVQHLWRFHPNREVKYLVWGGG